MWYHSRLGAQCNGQHSGGVPRTRISTFLFLFRSRISSRNTFHLDSILDFSEGGPGPFANWPPQNFAHRFSGKKVPRCHVTATCTCIAPSVANRTGCPDFAWLGWGSRVHSALVAGLDALPALCLRYPPRQLCVPARSFFFSFFCFFFSLCLCMCVWEFLGRGCFCLALSCGMLCYVGVRPHDKARQR